MVGGYAEFLLEKHIMSINESVVKYSDRFADILAMIDSPISKALIAARDEDRPVKTNYFDLAKDGDHLSFLMDAKAQQMSQRSDMVEVTLPSPVTRYYYSELLRKLDFDRKDLAIPEQGQVAQVVGETEWNGRDYVKLKFEGGGCVILKQLVKPWDGVYWEKNRQEIRVGRGIRALVQSLGMSFSDAEIEDFVNKFKANHARASDAFRNFDVVRGNMVAELYNEENYLHPDKGDIGNSCMKAKPGWYFGIYTLNHMVCSLLVLRSSKDPSKIVGRALLWKLNRPDGIRYMDRIYTNTPGEMQLFREYAKTNGWHYKSQNNNAANGYAVSPDGKAVDLGELRVRIKDMDYTAFPYVDTLKNLVRDGDGLYLSTIEGSDSKRLEDTQGQWVSDECEYCGGSGRRGCDDCDATGKVKCDDCDGDGDVDCSECDGGRKIDCPDCGGTGKADEADCQGCGGKGKADCPTCDGKGTEECGNCDGDGEWDCGNCDGDGYVTCDECG